MAATRASLQAVSKVSIQVAAPIPYLVSQMGLAHPTMYQGEGSRGVRNLPANEAHHHGSLKPAAMGSRKLRQDGCAATTEQNVIVTDEGECWWSQHS